MTAATRKAIGSYEVEAELARGGMGVVYLARQPELDRRAVLKTLPQKRAKDESLEERFRREGRAAARVHHQNVVAVYDCFAWRGERYIAQEYVDGEDLAGVLRAAPRLDPGTAAYVALEIARGLEEIHAVGTVHRDLKPSNILIGRTGETKIADFGIALDPVAPGLTRTGLAIGTPPYMSPEQLRGERVDPRSDLFSFGALFYEMLAGRPPFENGPEEAAAGLLRRMESGRYEPLRRRATGIPRALRRLVASCLHPKPRRRIASATDLRRALERFLGTPAPAECRAAIAAALWERQVFRAEGAETEVAPRPHRRARPARLRRLALAAVAWAVLLGVLVATGQLPVGGLEGIAAVWPQP